MLQIASALGAFPSPKISYANIVIRSKPGYVLSDPQDSKEINNNKRIRINKIRLKKKQVAHALLLAEICNLSQCQMVHCGPCQSHQTPLCSKHIIAATINLFSLSFPPIFLWKPLNSPVKPKPNLQRRLKV